MSTAFTIHYNDSVFCSEEDETLLDAAIFNDIDIPHNCQVGSCASCICTLVKGEIDALSELEYVLLPEQIEKGAILACQSIAKSDLVLTSFEE
ncbi:2Fe-2S iron-sulfur cluster-binding protein [Aestuariibacter salexigens]|uniref:2Fe-2S iron-sulfur cluster-binding protein n=1 Tax=Aestuariibacter salexigens TaxID=226010 RepID=UPI000406D548|nr:2Fe-2S iron-sulfur cluster binding domain-containing protein [Aestuariibacter salexigens]